MYYWDPIKEKLNKKYIYNEKKYEQIQINSDQFNANIAKQSIT